MSEDDIIRMALEAGIDAKKDTLCRYEGWEEPMKKFASLVAAAEREANAKLCNSLARWHGQLVTAAFDHAADSIRAKGETTDTNEWDKELRTRSKLQESSQNDTQ